MIDKEVKLEIIKSLIRGIEILFLAMVVTPLVAFLLKQDFPVRSMVVVVLTGSGMILTFLLAVLILWKRWK